MRQKDHFTHRRARLRFQALVVLSLLTVAGTIAADDILEIGSELWVDGPLAVQPGVDREAPAVAVDADLRSLMAWAAFGAERLDVWVRWLDPQGDPVDDPAMVNVTSADDQRYPRVALRPDGKSLVIWQSDEVDNSLPGSPTRVWIRGRLLNADLTPAASEILISSISTDLVIDVSADVAALSNGAFAVVWESNQSVGGDNDSTSIQGRIVSAAGALSGGQFQVNGLTSGGQRDPAVAALPGAGFVAVWAGVSSGSDTGTSIQGRVFANSGSPSSTDFQVNTTVAGTQDDPDVATDGSVLLAVWESPNGVTSRTQIFARVLNASGSPVGNDFQIHPTDSVYHQLAPRVAAAKPGSFPVAWYSDGSAGADPDRSVQARIVRSDGTFSGAQFQVNSSRSGAQETPAVAGTGSRFVVVYHDDDNPFAVNDDGIVGRTYDLCLFCDGFESGSTSSWSGSVP